jgi:hypothetical protein
MTSINNLLNDEISIKGGSIIEHIFKFNNDTKNEMLNTFQYSMTAIIPIFILIKIISVFIPDVDESKSSLLIISEMFGQLIILYIGLFIINRFIKFIPTFSKVQYVGSFKVINTILPMLFTALSFNTKLRNKADVLFNRLMVIIYGESYNKEALENEQKNKTEHQLTPVVLHQPFPPLPSQQQQHHQQQMPQQQQQQQQQQMPQQQQQHQQQQMPQQEAYTEQTANYGTDMFTPSQNGEMNNGPVAADSGGFGSVY